MLASVRAAHYRALALGALVPAGSPFRALPDRLLIVDVLRQRMGLLERGELLREFLVE